MTVIDSPTSPSPAGNPAVTVPPRWRRSSVSSLTARGEPMVWLTGGCVAVAVLMIVLLLLFIVWQGAVTFWPRPILQVSSSANPIVLGEPSRYNTFTEPAPDGSTRTLTRTLYKVGNYDVSGQDFTWVRDSDVTKLERPQWAITIERVAWGNAYGTLEGIIIDGQEIRDPAAAWAKFQQVHAAARRTVVRIEEIEKHQMGAISREIDRDRLKLRKIEMTAGKESGEYRAMQQSMEKRTADLTQQMVSLREKTQSLWSQVNAMRLIVKTAQGQVIPADRSKLDEPMYVWQVVRAYPANQLTFTQKAGVYVSRWREYLLDDPREANTEGGVYPAIIGTVLLTMIMVIIVVPIGVIAAIYLREYAKQGLLVTIVRISVNNLAGVPSIVFGVFGLGFFCYMIGGGIDQAFFPERLPNPTVGKSALVWASLTLALLTLPVVIVATEEALSAVPRSMREGSYACGASKWQTIWRIVLPRAMPGVMTGMILAIARGAGEVAPLMLVGAVKLAPELPIAIDPPFFGLDRSFMHLGFHIYDLGFQSRNSEAARSMVYTTTMLLISIVVFLNLAAMIIRSRLRKAYAAGQF